MNLEANRTLRNQCEHPQKLAFIFDRDVPNGPRVGRLVLLCAWGVVVIDMGVNLRVSRYRLDKLKVERPLYNDQTSLVTSLVVEPLVW